MVKWWRKGVIFSNTFCAMNIQRFHHLNNFSCGHHRMIYVNAMLKNAKFWQPSWILDHLCYSKVYFDVINEFFMPKYILMQKIAHIYVVFLCHKLIFQYSWKSQNFPFCSNWLSFRNFVIQIMMEKSFNLKECILCYKYLKVLSS